MTKLIKLIVIILMVILAFSLGGCGNGGNGRNLELADGDIETVRAQLAKNPALLHSRDNEGYALLHRAAKQGQLQLIELLLEKGAQIDERTHDGNNLTPLHLAAGEGHIDAVNLLLDKGADINAGCKGARFKGWTPLVFAAWNNHKDIVSLLLNKGAAVKPAYLLPPIYQGFTDIVQLLLAKNAAVNEPGSKAWSPLHLAVKKGHTDLVKLLLEHGADAKQKSFGDRTPLHTIHYWRKDHVEITRLLLAYGADVNALNSYRETPLHQAAREGFASTAALLLEKGADPNISSDEEKIPVDIADHEGHKAVVRLLLSLHTAAAKGDLSAVKKLLKTQPLLINTRDLDYKTPLHLAAENNHLQIAQLLIDHGAIVDVRSKYKTIQLLHGLVAQLLVPRVGRVKRVKEEKTPLDFAVQKGFVQLAQLLRTHMKEK